MKAMKIHFDVHTGKRAEGLDPRDENLQAYGGPGWQKLDGKNSYEIRLVQDDRDLSQYEDVEGVEVLRGEQEIEQALQQLEQDKPDRYKIDKEVAIADLQQKGEMHRLKRKTMREAAPDLHQRGIAGISKQKPEVPRPWS